MAEQLDLTTPINKGTISSYQVRGSTAEFNPPDKSFYSYTFLSKTTPDFVIYDIRDAPANTYGPGTAANLATARLRAMNTMNFSTISQHKRVIIFAQTDINPKTGQPFLPPGPVSGTPDV